MLFAIALKALAIWVSILLLSVLNGTLRDEQKPFMIRSKLAIGLMGTVFGL